MESSLARLGSGSRQFFLLLLEKLEPKNQQACAQKKYIFLSFNKNHFSCKNKNQLRSFSCSDVSNGGLTLEKEVFQKNLARLEKLVL
jgi:hypothetical protein